ncbi:MAG: hypothetical protein L0Z53_05445 [Acidobacteriales bacterium]|nr:hypothetical protein [Terriglobales bacterium]
MRLFRIQVLAFSVFIFVGWAVMQQPSATAGQRTAEQPSVTPQKGQSAEQQKKDVSECYNITKEKTGIDPSVLLSKKVPGLSEAGAATQDAASAAAAAAGGAPGASQPSVPAEGAPAADAEGKEAKLNKFQLANQACLQARGYLVKGQAPATAPAAEQPKQ